MSVIQHPSSYSSKEIFEFDEGNVTLESGDGLPIKAYQAIALLERVKYWILQSLATGE